jgi:hypothetical protein
MRSRHASTLILFLGAFAVLFCLSGIVFLQIANIASGRIVKEAEEEPVKPVKQRVTAAPRVVSRTTDGEMVVAEVDESGTITKTIYSSSSKDILGDFTVFAVPQDHYVGKVYVQTVVDSKLPLLKIYPLEVETGKIDPSLLNVTYESYSLSPNEETVAVMDPLTLTLYDLQSGLPIKSFPLNEGEVWSKEKGSWTSKNCFDEQVWYSQVSLETRSFCIN